LEQDDVTSHDAYVIFVELCPEAAVTELSNGEEGTVLQAEEDVSSSGSKPEVGKIQ
jgi:hypothetical protein